MGANFAYMVIFIAAIASALGVIMNNRNLSQELDRTKAKLTKKTDKIEELNKFIRASIIGGNSFCYLSITLISSQNDVGRFAVIHKGEYPMYDVHMRVVDLDKSDRIKHSTVFEEIVSAQHILDLGNLSAGTVQVRERITFEGKKELRFNIFTCARNGTTTQLLRMKLINNKWVIATKVTKLKGDTEEVLYEDIDEGYPRNKNGDVDW